MLQCFANKININIHVDVVNMCWGDLFELASQPIIIINNQNVDVFMHYPFQNPVDHANVQWLAHFLGKSIDSIYANVVIRSTQIMTYILP